MVNHQLMETMFETMPNCVIIDSNEIIVYMNKVYADLLGLPLDQIIGYPVAKVIPGTRLPIILKDGKSEIGHLMKLYDHTQKKEVELVCNRFPLRDGDGKIIGAAAMTTFEDLTDLNHMYKELAETKSENERFRQRIDQLKGGPLGEIIGSSQPIMAIKQTIAEFAPSNLTIMLTGETGVGKEVFANAIHQLSRRKDSPFIKINCAAIPAELLESELFGYEEGAFTGAKKGGRPGRFEMADTGTLLLDEIGEMPLPLQAKLLRVLQEKEIERLGGGKVKKIDIRLICSTNVNISRMVAEGKFREDLYYRLNTIELMIPPLRDRAGDIAPLCYYFIKKINAEHGLNVIGIEDEVIELFQNYKWPGNVRELEHVMERLAVKSGKDIIRIKDCQFLIERMVSGQSEMHPKQQTSVLPAATDVYLPPTRSVHLRDSQDFSEKAAIINALAQTGGNRKLAAQLLGISRSSLYNKLNKYRLLS